MSITTTTYHKIQRIEIEYSPDESDPTYSFLTLRVYSHGAGQADKISFFPCSPLAADHLHNIFLACNLMCDLPSGDHT